MKKSPLVATTALAGALTLGGCAAPVHLARIDQIEMRASEPLNNLSASHLGDAIDALDCAVDALGGGLDVVQDAVGVLDAAVDDAQLVIRLLALLVRAISAVRKSLQAKKSTGSRKRKDHQ